MGKKAINEINSDSVLEMRKLARENQQEFWTRFGVTQSGGSRYESGRDMPESTAILIALFADGKISDDDIEKAKKKLPKYRKLRQLKKAA